MGTNFWLLSALAHAVGPDSFGRGSLAVTTFSVAAALAATAIAETALVSSARNDSTAGPEAVVAAAGFGIFAAVISALLNLLWFQSDLGWVVAAAMTPLVCQEVLRHMCIGTQRPHLALLSDCSWLAVQAVAFQAVSAPSALSLGIGWAVAGMVAAIVALLVTRWTWPGSGPISWYRRHARVSRSHFTEGAALATATFGAGYALAGLSTAAEGGALRAAQTALGPANVLFVAARSFGIGEVRSSELRIVRSQVLRLSGKGALIGACLVVVALEIPTSIGTAVFSDRWKDIEPLLLPLAVQRIAVGMSLGSFVYLRVLRRLDLSFRLRLFNGALSTIGGICGATMSARHAAWGLAMGSFVGETLTFYAVQRELRRNISAAEPPFAEGVP